MMGFKGQATKSLAYADNLFILQSIPDMITRYLLSSFNLLIKVTETQEHHPRFSHKDRDQTS